MNNLQNNIEECCNTFQQNIFKYITPFIENQNNILEKEYLKINREKEALKNKDSELENFRKVSFISSMNKQVNERDQQIIILKKQLVTEMHKFRKIN